MNPRICMAIAVASLLTGCAAVESPGTRTAPDAAGPSGARCNGRFCWLEVTVVSSGAQCAVRSVDPDVLRVDSPGPNNLIWSFSEPGYSFPKNGVAFTAKPGESLPPNAGQVFQCRPEGKADKFFHCNNNRQRGRYPYKVIALRADGTVCSELDPIMIND